MSRLNKGLLVLVVVSIVFSAIVQVGLLGTVIELNNQVTKQSYKIANKDLQLSILWQETNSLQEINFHLNEKNRELRGQANFFESQNQMLMDREVSE